VQTNLFHSTTCFGPAGPSLVYVTPVEHLDIFIITDTHSAMKLLSEENIIL